MRTASIGFAVLVASLGATASAFAQHEGHDTSAAATTGVSPQLVSQCVDSQQQSLGLVDAANARLESARQSNSPTEIRAAMADLQRVLLDVRTVLSRCTELQQALATAPPPATPGHDVSNAPGTATAPGAAPPVADPHAGHVTPPAQAPAPNRAPTAAPRSLSPAPRAAAPQPPANHMVMVQTAFDPAKLSCSPKIDPKTAAKTTYQGKTYYFCSAKDRDEFLTNPAMSLSMRPPKQ